MYSLKEGQNLLKEWRNTEDDDSSEEALKNSTFRVQPSLEEEITQLVQREDIPFESRSQLTRILWKLISEIYQNQ
jgi:hypothetical protein